MADTAVILGGVTFTGFEIPEKINFGGRQQVAVHRLIGGSRVVDAMGPDPEPVKWQGQFRGPNALARAQALDEIRRAGAVVELTWFDIFRAVVVTDFHADTERFYEVPYSITCEVIDDGQGAGLGAITGGLDALVAADLASATTAASSGSAAASAAVASAQASIDAVDGLAGASSSTLAGVSASVSSASATLAGIVSVAEAQIGVGAGSASSTFAPDMAAWLTGQLAVVQSESVALDTKAYVDRVAVNLALNPV